jgi:hypothetical protein
MLEIVAEVAPGIGADLLGEALAAARQHGGGEVGSMRYEAQ